MKIFRHQVVRHFLEVYQFPSKFFGMDSGISTCELNYVGMHTRGNWYLSVSTVHTLYPFQGPAPSETERRKHGK